ncbi:hypothetical protein FH972_024226 [Carpinus fangiana]|uniref:COP9 signalosome complex subunit 4 n=1 Tax=Carpinus fangiana TaxID=176857 RepID=A0A5N6KZY4_9ROSI|nr:hypothetical protein FH972_024226 [Carpinus fangiana]
MSSSPIQTSFADAINEVHGVPAANRPAAYEALLEHIYSSTEVEAGISAYLASLLGSDRTILDVTPPTDPLSIVQSRTLLAAFTNRLSQHPSQDLHLSVAQAAIALIQPRVVSFEEQDAALKLLVASAFESQEDYIASARTLATINLDSNTSRNVSDTDRANIWVRIVRCFLEEDDPTSALQNINRIKNISHNIKDPALLLQFRMSQARILDSQRSFLDASAAYHTVSLDSSVDEDDRLQTLSAAIACAVLAPAGPLRARALARLYKDDRAQQVDEYSILEKIFLDRVLEPAEVQAFAAKLPAHQLARTADGTTVLERAVLEHNLLGASKLYRNIGIEALGLLLGVDAERAEQYAAGMIEQGRLVGSIDQIDQVIFFAEAPAGDATRSTKTRDGDKKQTPTTLSEMRQWDANVQRLAEEVAHKSLNHEVDESTNNIRTSSASIVEKGERESVPHPERWTLERACHIKSVLGQLVYGADTDLAEHTSYPLSNSRAKRRHGYRDIMETPSLPLVPIAKVLGITSSMFLAGSTATYSFLLVPTILSTSSSEATIASQWRTAYRIGFYVTPPQCLIAGASWTYLALTVPSEAFGLRVLYTTAAILIPSIIPYTITIQRKLNATLSRRAERLCGPGEGTRAEKLGIDDEQTKQEEESGESTRDLVDRWSKHNYGRAAMVGIGALCGVWASLNEAFLSGVQVGANAIIGELLKQQALAKAGTRVGAIETVETRAGGTNTVDRQLVVQAPPYRSTEQLGRQLHEPARLGQHGHRRPGPAPRSCRCQSSEDGAACACLTRLPDPALEAGSRPLYFLQPGLTRQWQSTSLRPVWRCCTEVAAPFHTILCRILPTRKTLRRSIKYAVNAPLWLLGFFLGILDGIWDDLGHSPTTGSGKTNLPLDPR